MRRALAWVTGIVGVAALARLLHGRRHAAADSAPPEPGDPADELRQALAARRSADEEQAPAAAADGRTPEERRAAVHARAEEAIAQMRDEARDR